MVYGDDSCLRWVEKTSKTKIVEKDAAVRTDFFGGDDADASRDGGQALLEVDTWTCK